MTGTAGQRKKDFIQAGAAHREIRELDARVEERAQRLVGLSRRARHDRKSRTFDTALNRAAEMPLEKPGCLVETMRVGERDMEKAGARGLLQLAARAFRDLAAVVDDGDALRELVGLVHILCREQDRHAG